MLHKIMNGTDKSQAGRNNVFTLGVVEGFYGMPWSAEQKKILFSWMHKMGLNTYMYAPKDDSKHRAHWRDLYSVEEADILTNLIDSALEKGVTFVYAISPGLDIAFSNTKDVTALKRKLEQVSTFGCKAFALLFDDIDLEMSEADKSAFSSFAHAQVSVANEVFEHLGQPKFLFCPTEYCATRAIPNIHSSGYLKTLGSKLLPGIDVMWTGCKVISKKITVQTLATISSVLKRPPIIWDNIHANDYDPRRIFLGPYDGRSPDIIPYIRGVMTNPNCEFESNYIACHTLGQWFKSNKDAIKKDMISINEQSSPIAADIKLETENDACSVEDPTVTAGGYNPRQALKIAISDWYHEFMAERHPNRRFIPAQMQFSVPPDVQQFAGPSTVTRPTIPGFVPSGMSVSDIPVGIPLSDTNSDMAPGIPISDVPTGIPVPELPKGITVPEIPAGMPVPDLLQTCTVSTPTVITPTTSVQGMPSGCRSGMPFTPAVPPPDQMLEVLDSDCTSVLQPLAQPFNTLAEDCIITDLDGLSDSGTEGEAMDCIPCAVSGTTPMHNSIEAEKNGSSESLMQVDSSDSKVGNCTAAIISGGKTGSDRGSVIIQPHEFVTLEDISLLPELFNLPFEHGTKALQFLSSLHWLIENVSSVQHSKRGTAEYRDWQGKASEFEKCVLETDVMLRHLFYSPNKSLLCCLHTYIWDLKCTLSVCLAYIKWLEHGLITCPSALPNCKMATWFSEGYKEAFMSGDMEPWAFRGGLQSELQRFLPIMLAHELFFIKPPEIIVPVLPRFRPYQPQDEAQVYDICLKTCDDGMDGTDVFPENPKLIGDRLVGRFLTLSPEFCFVVEDQHGIYGYVLAAQDARSFITKTKVAWTPAMCQKYPKPLHDDISPAEEVILSFHNEATEPSEEVMQRFPSILRLDILPNRLTDQAVPRRLLACALCVLKAVGSHGAFTELIAGDEFMADVYAKLGFITVRCEVSKGSDNMMYMGRMF